MSMATAMGFNQSGFKKPLSQTKDLKFLLFPPVRYCGNRVHPHHSIKSIFYGNEMMRDDPIFRT